MDMHVLLVLSMFWITSQAQFLDLNRIRLTAERGGPPQGAQYVPIPTITGFPTGPRPFKRPQKISGIPPPPPEPPTFNTEEPLTIPLTTMAPPEEITEAVVSVVTSGGVTPPPPPPIHGVVSVTQPGIAEPDQSTTTAPPSSSTTDDGVVYNHYNQDDDGSYFFEYLTKSALHRKEQGFFKHETGFPDKVHVKTGLYSFISPEGVPIRVDYIADEKGYRAYDNRDTARIFANTLRRQ